MLFNPGVLAEQPIPLLVTVATIVVGKSMAAYLIVRLFGHSNQTALTISASLAQIGEFSFILATLGSGLELLPDEGRDLILAGAIISIFLNPFIFNAVVGGSGKVKQEVATQAMREEVEHEKLREKHVIVIGYGRVGKIAVRELHAAPTATLLIEAQADLARQAREDGFEVVHGNAVEHHILQEAGIDNAHHMIIAVPEGFEASAIVEQAKRLRPKLPIIARAHSDAQVKHLIEHGADEVVMGEREIARQMVKLVSTTNRQTSEPAQVSEAAL